MFRVNLLVLTLFFKVMSCIKLTDIMVPEITLRGEPSWLNCSYDLGNDPLYSVKWFKKNENEVKEEYIWSEIYRFEPNNVDNTKVSFPMKGVAIDLIKSSQGNILLSNVSMETEGTYRCEVVGDAPNFEMVRDERHMKVYYFAQNQPIIRGLKTSYQIGDYVNANCSITFPRSHFKSMTKLSWFINNDPAPTSFVSSVKGRRMLSALISTHNEHPAMYNDERMVPTKSSANLGENTEISDEPWTETDKSFGINNVMANSIKFLVNPRHFNQGLMRIKCIAQTIPELYSRSAEDVARQERIKGSSSNNNYNIGRYSSSSLSTNNYISSTKYLTILTTITLWLPLWTFT